VDEIPAVERELAFDIAKRGLIVSPFVVAACGLLFGWDGAWSAAIGLAIVIVNFLVAALIVDRWTKVSPTAVGAASLAGYLLRLVVIVIALVLLRNQSWIDLPVLGFTLVGAQLGLLAWEARHVSLTLAAPGLRPPRPTSSGDQ
jgi:hypothetical protein